MRKTVIIRRWLGFTHVYVRFYMCMCLRMRELLVACAHVHLLVYLLNWLSSPKVWPVLFRLPPLAPNLQVLFSSDTRITLLLFNGALTESVPTTETLKNWLKRQKKHQKTKNKTTTVENSLNLQAAETLKAAPWHWNAAAPALCAGQTIWWA
jgi:hypothetical protein